MKKLALILVAALSISISGFGQIKVNSAGRAFFGSGTGTTSYGAINLTVDGTTSGISLTGTSTNRYNIFKYSDDLYITPTASISKGMRMGPGGGIVMASSSLYNISTTAGLLTFYTTSLPGIVLYGSYGTSGKQLIRADIDNSNTSNMAFAVYRIDKNQGINERTYYVNGAGTVYAKNGYIQSSDHTNKTEITLLENALDKISALSAISFYYKDYAEEAQKSLANYKRPGMVRQENDSLTADIDITPETINKMKSEVSRKRIGLIAQQVEEIVPEVVRTMEDGKKGIMYSDLVSLLIEAVKELKEQQDTYVTELEEELSTIKEVLFTIGKDPVQLKKEEMNAELKEVCKLYQNKPNPFNQETEIVYEVPGSSAVAYIGVYNLNGTQMKKYPIYDSTGSITISASELQPGIYIYSLIVDGQEIDSKRMILTD